MFSLKSRLVSCPLLWHLKVKPVITQSSSWLQFISTTQHVTESASGIDSDTFGNLALTEEGQNTRKKTKYRSHITLQRSHHDQNPRNEIDESSHPSEDISADYVLDKWHQFKDEEFSRILRRSRNLQDDGEEEFYTFRKVNLTDTVEKSMGHTKETIPERQSDQMPSLDTFGTLQPLKNEYENETGDEGDKREEKFEEAQLKMKYPPQYYGQQMRDLCRENKLNEALKILEEEMPSVGAKPNDYCYQILIGACGRAGYTKKAFQLYNQMKKRGLRPKHVAYTGLFNACANSPWPLMDGIGRATKLRQQLIEKGVILNSKTSHAMIKAFGRCGDMKTAFQIVDDMVEQGLLITTESLNFLLQACITNHNSGFRHALLVWRKMRQLNLTPDIYSYNLLVRAISECKAGDQQLANQLLQDMLIYSKTRKTKKKADLTSKNTEKVLHIESKENGDEKGATGVIESKYTEVEVARNVARSQEGIEVLPELLGKNVSLGRVIELTSLDLPENRLALLGGPAGIFKHMNFDKVKADVRTATQMLDSLPENTQAEEALLKSMKNMDITPDSQFCNKLIKKRSFRKDIDAAKDVLDIMQEHHLAPDLITFGCLALGCHRLYDARNFLKDMDNLNFRPNVEVMTSLVKNSVLRGDYYFTMEILCEMRDRNIIPDKHLIGILEKARKRARDMILKLENDTSTQKHNNYLEGMKLFLMEYKTWLKGTALTLPDHPWAQYRATSSSSR